MPIKVAKAFVHLIIVLMMLECFVVYLASPPSCDLNHETMGVKSFISVLCSTLAETEEEKNEHASVKVFAVELADFSKIISFLSKTHTPHKHFIVFDHPDNHQGPLFKLFRTLLI